MKDSTVMMLNAFLLLMGCVFIITMGFLTWKAVAHLTDKSPEGITGMAVVFSTVMYGLGWLHVTNRLL